MSHVFSDESEDESVDDLDSSFILSESETEDDGNEPELYGDDRRIKCKAFIVFWSSLIMLFNRCFTYFDKFVKANLTTS